jgi:hypothetical protein
LQTSGQQVFGVFYQRVYLAHADRRQQSPHTDQTQSGLGHEGQALGLAWRHALDLIQVFDENRAPFCGVSSFISRSVGTRLQLVQGQEIQGARMC